MVLVSTSHAAASANDAIADFIQAAIALHRIASALHADGDDDDDDNGMSSDGSMSGHGIAAVATHLKRAVEHLQASRESSAPFGSARSDVVFKACLKIGQDLLVKLPRLESSAAADADDDNLSNEKVVDVANFRALWPSLDLDVLGLRLTELMREWSDVCPEFE
jgi:hypothetical protein